MTAFALWARAIPQSRRWPLYATAAGLAVAGWALVTYAQGFLLQLAGKSDDLTGRLDTWANVIALAEQRPVLGWGWLSPWVPWLEPFNTLAIRNGVTYLQAHNTWLDVWMQLGWVGVLALGMTVLGVFWRSWFIAVDRPRWGLDENLPYSVHSLLPLLFMSALVLQSFAESQLIVQSGLALLVIFSLSTTHYLSRGIFSESNRYK
jgi:O-antigen ligase